MFNQFPVVHKYKDVINNTKKNNITKKVVLNLMIEIITLFVGILRDFIK